MKRIGIIARLIDPETKKLIDQIVQWLSERGREVSYAAAATGESSRLIASSDLVIVLGGDGTLISAARDAEATGVPLLGVNLGFLGFLTEVRLAELFPTLEMVLKNEFIEEPRMTLRSILRRDGETLPQPTVLNDVAVTKGGRGRMIRLEVSINGQFVTALRADGLIVSTPTGSTGYAMSSGGPIVNPQLEAIILTPISPHVLTQRPLVVPANGVVQIRHTTIEGGASAYFDGQVVVPLKPNDILETTKNERPVKLIRAPDKNYYQVLRGKLKWGE